MNLLRRTPVVLANAALTVVSISGIAHAATIDGTDSGDLLVGTAGSDVILGYEGNDVVRGKAGADQLYGGMGSDEIHGGSGTDEIYAAAGADWTWLNDYGVGALIRGGNGDDALFIDSSRATGLAALNPGDRNDYVVQSGADSRPASHLQVSLADGNKDIYYGDPATVVSSDSNDVIRSGLPSGMVLYSNDIEFFISKIERPHYGAPQLSHDSCLDDAAAAWAQRMASTGVFAHSDTLALLSQCDTTSIGEILLYDGQGTPDEQVLVWYSSSAHRAIMLDKRYTIIGVGIAEDPNYPGLYYYAALLAAK